MYTIYYLKHAFIFADITQLETPIEADIVIGPDALKEVDKMLLTLSYAVRPMEILVLGDPDLSFKKFTKEVKPIVAGGGVVINSKHEMLVMKRQGRWDFPKGKLEKNETIEEGAMREVEEECNVFGLSIVDKLTMTYHIYQNKGKNWLKVSHWYVMNCEDDRNAKPQIEEDIEEIKWVDPVGFEIRLEESYPSILDVLATYRTFKSQ